MIKVFGAGHRLRHGPEFESTATKRLIEFNERHLTGIVSITGTLTAFFGAHLPSNASFPAQLHFGRGHVSGLASGKSAHTLPFKFSYANMWSVNLKPQSDDEGVLVELRFDLCKVRDAVATDTTDNVLQLAIPQSQAQALRQRCLPHLPASIERTDTIQPLAPSDPGMDRARHPGPSTSAQPSGSQSMDVAASSQHVLAGDGCDGIGASSGPAVAPRGARDAKQQPVFPSFDQVVRLKNSKEEAVPQQRRGFARSQKSASTAQQASDPSGARKRVASTSSAAKPAPYGKPTAKKVAASKPASKQPAAGAKKPALVNALGKADAAAALHHSEGTDEDDTNAACADGGDGASSADGECEAVDKHDSKNQPARAATVQSGTRSSMRSAAVAARVAIQRAALADCIASVEAASTGHDATKEGFVPAPDEATAGDEDDGSDEAVSDEEAGDALSGRKANVAGSDAPVSAHVSEESSGEAEESPQSRRKPSASAGRSVAPSQKLASGAAGPLNGNNCRLVAAKWCAFDDELSSGESAEEASEGEAPLRQRVSKMAEPNVPSKSAPAAGGAKSRIKPVAAAAASVDLANRRRSAWNRFLKSKKASMEREHPGIHYPEVQKLIAAMWAKMGQAEKDAWPDQPSTPTIIGAGPSSAEGIARLEPSIRFAPISVAAASPSDCDESVTGSPSHESPERTSSDARLDFVTEAAACARYDGHERMSARQPFAHGGGEAVHAASFPAHSNAGDSDQMEDSDGIERGRTVLPWPASSALGHAATKNIPQMPRRESRAGAAAEDADEVEQLLGRLSEASRTWRRSHIEAVGARGRNEINQYAVGTKRKLAAVHQEAPVSADQLQHKCQLLIAAWESLKAAHESVCTARLRTSQAYPRMLRQLEASRDGQKRRVTERLQELSAAVTEEQKKARAKRARESKKLQDGGNALQNLMMDLGSVMNLASFDESE